VLEHHHHRLGAATRFELKVVKGLQVQVMLVDSPVELAKLVVGSRVQEVAQELGQQLVRVVQLVLASLSASYKR